MHLAQGKRLCIGVTTMTIMTGLLAAGLAPSPRWAPASLAVSTELDLARMGAGLIEVDRQVLITVLHRVGLTPEALTVCGATVEDVAPLVRRTAEHLLEAEWALSSADELCSTREAEVMRLKRRFETGTTQEGDVDALARAETAAAQAQAARLVVLNTIFEAATEGLAPEEVQILRTVRSNLAHGGNPELLVVARSADDWASLHNAVALCRENQRRQPPAEAAQLLASARADAPVVAARERLVSLPAIQQAWLDAVTPR